MKYLFSAFILMFVSDVQADVPPRNIVNLQLSKNDNYSDRELRERVFRLERAVWQLQQKVFALQTNSKRPSEDTTVCFVKAMGNNHSATGPNKAVAKHKAMEKCKKANKGDGFFCKFEKCE